MIVDNNRGLKPELDPVALGGVRSNSDAGGSRAPAVVEGIAKLCQREDLDDRLAYACMGEIMGGRATDAQMAAFLVALRQKGETAQEIASFAQVMREKCIQFEVGGDVLDTCGTGGDKLRTFNVSTAAAIVAAAGGVKIAKHVSRAFSGTGGSADCLEALGVNVELLPEDVASCMGKVGIGFLFAPNFHPATKYAQKARQEIGVSTVFNILLPLTNPFGARRQAMGVHSPELVPKVADALVRLGCQRGFVFHGMDGLDEVSILGQTKVAMIMDGSVAEFELGPQELGLQKAQASEIAGGTAKENAKIIRDVFGGERGPAADFVIANAALALVAGGKSDKIIDGVGLAKELIESGAAAKKLKSAADFSAKRKMPSPAGQKKK